MNGDVQVSVMCGSVVLTWHQLLQVITASREEGFLLAVLVLNKRRS